MPRSCLISLLTKNENLLFGIKFEQNVINMKNQNIGDMKHIKYEKFDIVARTVKDTKLQFISYSKIKKHLKEIKLNRIVSSSGTLYFCHSELEAFNIKYMRSLIQRIFKNKKLIFCNILEENWKENEITAMNASNGSFLSPTIECTFLGERIRALVDTGAQISLVDYEFMSKRGLETSTEDYGSVMGITGNAAKIKGIINTTLTFEDQEVQTKLHVIEGGMDTPIILGMDTLVNGKFNINLDDLSVTCRGRLISQDKSMCKAYREVQDRNFRANRNIYLKGHHGIDVTFLVEDSQDMYVVNQTNSFLQSRGIIYPQYECQAMEQVKNNKVNITIENTTNSTIKIKKGSLIANLSFVQKEEQKSKILLTQMKDTNVKDDKNKQDEFLQKIIERTEDKKETKNFKNIILENQDAFAQDDKDLGQVKSFEHRIDLKHDRPIASKPYRIPHSRMEVVENEIQRMLDTGVIRPSKSPYAAPCLLVWKKNGKPRLVIDYRNLNKIVEPFQYPLPHLESAIHSLGGNEMFSTLDLISGYHQISLREEDMKKTAFTTGRGLYEFTRTPFGLITSGAVMQSIMERVLIGLNHKICLVYVDDVIIAGKTKEDHDKNLDLVLRRLRLHGFKIRIDKCVFRSSQVECLGHVISSAGIIPNPDKTESLKSRPIPKNAKGVKSFLGVCGYYRRFVNNYSEISKPLIELTKKNVKFVWSSDCQKAYNKLIQLLTSPPILTYPDYNIPFIITTDASRSGIGAVLSQIQNGEEKPIAYYSRKLNQAETRYPIFDLEGLAIKVALNKWRLYVYGYNITIRTDNLPIIGILKNKNCEGRIAKYLSTIQMYNIDYVYLPGKHNIIADFLSRSCEEGDKVRENLKAKTESEIIKINLIKQEELFTSKEFQKATCEDLVIQNMVQKKHALYEYVNENKVWYCINKRDGNHKLMIPEKMIMQTIKHFHSILGVHQGTSKTYRRLNDVTYWHGMKEDVRRFVHQCKTCKEGKFDHRSKHVLGSLPEPEAPFQRIHIDIVGPFGKGKYKNKFICTIVDAFSRYVIAKAITKKSSKKIIDIIFHQLIEKGRTPKHIITDFGSEFTSHEFVDFCFQWGILVNYTPPYHHSSNGLVERVNYSIESLLRCALIERKGNWVECLPNVVNAINSSQHEATGVSPNQVLGETSLTGIKLIDQYAHKRKPCDLVEVANKSRKYLSRMRNKENKFRRYVNYKIGESVYVKVTNVSGKLQAIYQGPGTITEVNGHQVSVKIGQNIFRKVHVDFLKR